MLAARTGVPVAEAFAGMRAHARRHGLALTTVAQAVVEGSRDVSALTRH